MSALNWLLIIHCGATVYMTGLIWFVQVVHYPLFDGVGRDLFPDYERRHARRTGWVVGPPMLAELGAALAIVWTAGGVVAWTGLALLSVIWLSTAVLQIPAHRALARGFDPAVHRRLVGTNWLRTIAWTARSGIALAMLAG